jgi:hypothetical protein
MHTGRDHYGYGGLRADRELDLRPSRAPPGGALSDMFRQHSRPPLLSERALGTLTADAVAVCVPVPRVRGAEAEPTHSLRGTTADYANAGPGFGSLVLYVLTVSYSSRISGCGCLL